eukprot:scaffold654300_cov66-Prasinocladus_malaysianus.AAC.1
MYVALVARVSHCSIALSNRVVYDDNVSIATEPSTDRRHHGTTSDSTPQYSFFCNAIVVSSVVKAAVSQTSVNIHTHADMDNGVHICSTRC